jgi:predicted ATPase
MKPEYGCSGPPQTARQRRSSPPNQHLAALPQPSHNDGRRNCVRGAWKFLHTGDCYLTLVLGLTRQDVAPDESILSQWKDPNQFPELAHLSDAYSKVRIYREWSFGRTSVFRRPQDASLPTDRLEEDFSNLGLFLNQLRGVPKAKKAIIAHLRDLYAGLDDFDVRIKGGTVEVFLTEQDFIIPASRLSDGTLRYLCLLAILCDPEPPALVCIEEPELGLHPDMLPKIADLLVAASERTQVVITTHSDLLVDAMTERPEAVIVIEKHDGKTQAKRLEATQELDQWLQKYRLGQLWTRGEIGGTRW